MKPELITLRKNLIQLVPHVSGLSVDEMLDLFECFSKDKLKAINKHKPNFVTLRRLSIVPEYYKLDAWAIDKILTLINTIFNKKKSSFSLLDVVHIPEFYKLSIEQLEFFVKNTRKVKTLDTYTQSSSLTSDSC
jgi:hypothetical protein